MCEKRNKLNNQMELRNRMALDADFEAEDIVSFDECIQRCQRDLEQEQKELTDRVKDYQFFVQRRKDKDFTVFSNGLGDEILKRDWYEKQKANVARLAILEKAAGYPCLK